MRSTFPASLAILAMIVVLAAGYLIARMYVNARFRRHIRK